MGWKAGTIEEGKEERGEGGRECDELMKSRTQLWRVVVDINS
jgi:hypothetical protein